MVKKLSVQDAEKESSPDEVPEPMARRGSMSLNAPENEEEMAQLVQDSLDQEQQEQQEQEQQPQQPEGTVMTVMTMYLGFMINNVEIMVFTVLL
jgi:hypothetical protein